MRTVIHWKGKAYSSVEYCTIDSNADGYNIRSEVSSCYGRHICQLVYEIETTRQWDTQAVRVAALVGDQAWSCRLEKRTTKWFLDGRLVRSFDPHAFPDISLTPFTNTLPINGLNWSEPAHVIDVIHFDVLSRKVLPAKQLYRRTGPGHFQFTTNYESLSADIIVDHDGLVSDYPGLFKCIAKQQFAGRA